MLNTGLRVGEALALRYEDINLENKTLSVNHTLSKVSIRDKNKNSVSKTEYILAEPKTKTSKELLI